VKKKIPTEPKNRPPLKHRQFAASELARCGYWSTPAQKIVKRWRKIIGEQWCRHYMAQCAAAVFTIGSFEIEPYSQGHKSYIFEMLLVLHKFWNDRQKPGPWLLEMGDIGSGMGFPPRPRNFDQIQQRIKAQCGIWFDTRALAQAAKRLRLNDRIAQ